MDAHIAMISLKQDELDAANKTIAELREALEAASDHLDYVGYGDSWEQECAEATGLEKKINAALAKGKQ